MTAQLGSLLLALLAALGVDRLTERRGLLPPAFRAAPEAPTAARSAALARRALAGAGLAAVLWLGVFGPLGTLGSGGEIDLSRVDASQLFVLHLLFAIALALWYLLGFSPRGARAEAGEAGRVAVQFGLRSPRLWPEIGWGLVAGVAGWLLVVLTMLALGALLWLLGAEEALPQEPPALVPWIAGLPAWIRLAVSLSAGFVEETFFRGFLQPRAGIALSTLFFVLAHLSYEQAFMLAGISLLSLFFAFLVQWRRNIWPAVVAHAVFDGIQLLVVIPLLLDYLPEGAGGLAAGAATAGGFW